MLNPSLQGQGAAQPLLGRAVGRMPETRGAENFPLHRKNSGIREYCKVRSCGDGRYA